MQPSEVQPRSVKSLIVIGLLSLALASTVVVAFMMYNSNQDYKNNADQKIAIAVKEAEVVQAAKLRQEFEQQSKFPSKTYNGSVTYGSVTFDYPKTWSVYVSAANSEQPIDTYFHPQQVPALDSESAYGVRLELVASEYSDVLGEFNAAITEGSVTAKAYIPPKMAGVANMQPGTRLDGAIGGEQQQGSMVILRVRDKTLKLYTLSNDYRADFDNILTTLTFVP